LTVSLNLNDKKAVVAEVSAKVATAQTIVVAEYRGIQVAHLTQLRAKARAQGVYLRVLKNTSLVALLKARICRLWLTMTGPLIYAISDDAVAAAKVVADFAKTNDKLVIKAGNYAGKRWIKLLVALASTFPKFSFRSCWALCWLRCRALHVVWLLWQRKSEGAPAGSRRSQQRSLAAA
jgi:large subunit ribosomal protein L10